MADRVARLIATLARIVRDVGVAEELAQDAFVIALEPWPKTGVPDDPGPWLRATAKHARAAELTRNERERASFLARATDRDTGTRPGGRGMASGWHSVSLLTSRLE